MVNVNYEVLTNGNKNTNYVFSFWSILQDIRTMYSLILLSNWYMHILLSTTKLY